MQALRPRRRAGFTLIELLAVIAIITLLIGLLVPAVSRIRIMARNSKTSGMLATIGSGCEMFNSEMDEYPRSSGPNPFEGDDAVRLAGAQWLLMQLVGPDFRGYVKPSRENDTSQPPNGITATDWLDWYDPTSPANVTRQAPYVDISGDIAKSPERYAAEMGLELPASLEAGTSVWKNDQVSFFIDAFSFPVLYYRANAQAEQAFSEWSGATLTSVGRYDQVDNEIITGSSAEDGLDLGPGEPKDVGAMYELGWSSSAPTDAPLENSFAEALFDRGLFEQTPGAGAGKGRVWPHRPDTFILITPGNDGIYGTGDDVKNF